MHRLRDAGNTLVVVEHDPAVMLAADRLIDMGPGPGANGGRIVFDGTPDAARSADTLTGAYLGARKHVGIGIRRYVNDATPKLLLEGAREHNLKNLERRVPAAAADGGDRRVGFRQEHAGARRAGACAAAPLRQGHRITRRPRSAARRRLARRSRVRRPERRSARPRAATPRVMSAHSTSCASCSPMRRWRASATTAPACSASTPATAAARPAAARASSTWRCSSCPTSICAAPIATGAATVPRFSRCASCAARASSRWPTCSTSRWPRRARCFATTAR